MRPNPLKAKWAVGEATVNGWLAAPSAVTAEVMAHQGWDSLTIDLQHGLIDYQAALAMAPAIQTTATTPLCRLPWNEPGIAMKLLDAGVLGLICPMVNSRGEAEAFVGACRYAPMGHRSFGPTRALLSSGADYVDHANREIALLAMIETRKALDNLEEIVATPGLDGVYIGPGDLGLSLGFAPKMDREEPELVAEIDRILTAAVAAGKVAGVHCGEPAYARRMIAKGFRMVTIQSDLRLMARAASEVLAEMRGRPAHAKGAGY